MTITALWPRLARTARWHRRPLAALCAGLAVLCALSALRPAAPPGTAVVVAAHDLPAGRVLSPDDLAVEHYPSGLAPQGALAVADDAVGRTIAAAVTRGTPVTSATTVSAALTPAPGEVLVGVRVADASLLSLVQVGDRVTVVGAGQDQAVATLATRVRVAALPQPAAAGPTGGADAPLVVVSCDPATARTLAAWSSAQTLSITLG